MANDLPEGVFPMGLRFQVDTEYNGTYITMSGDFFSIPSDPEERQTWFNAFQAGADAIVTYLQTAEPTWVAQGGQVLIMGTWTEAVDTSP